MSALTDKLKVIYEEGKGYNNDSWVLDDAGAIYG